MIIFQLIILGILIALFCFTLKNIEAFKKPSLDSSFIGKKRPLVSILIPARNEEKKIANCIRSLTNQTYSKIEILVLNDHSTDKTSQVVNQLARKDKRIKCLSGKSLPKEWTGKTFAMQQLSLAAKGEWLLFCDADTTHSKNSVETVLNEALANKLDGLSLFPHQKTETFGEKLIIPLMFFVLTSYLPLREVRSNPKPAFSAGCGQFFFIRKKAFTEIGGMEKIKETLHDGSKLPYLLKSKGKSFNVYDGQQLVSCRMYTSFQSLWEGISRSLFTGIQSSLLLFVNVAWHLILFVMPVLFIVIGLITGKPFVSWILFPALQLIVAADIRYLQNARMSLPRWPVFLTPISIALLCALQIHSFLRHKVLRTVEWKGRQITATP